MEELKQLTNIAHKIYYPPSERGITMKGNIYVTKSGYLVWFPLGKERDIRRRCIDKAAAERFLTGLRFKYDEGTLDGRDYRVDNPLGFANLVEKFMETKRLLKDPGAYRKKLKFAVAMWGNRNVKSIGFSCIQELLLTMKENGYSSRYRHEIKNTIKHFYNWLLKSREIKYEEMPEFPTVKYSTPYRKIMSKETQLRILREIKRITNSDDRYS